MEIHRSASETYSATVAETGSFQEAVQKVIPPAGSQNDWKKTFVENEKKRVIEKVVTVMREYMPPGDCKKQKTETTKAEIQTVTRFVNKALKESSTREKFNETVAAQLYHGPIVFLEKLVEKQAQNPIFAWKLPFLETARSPTRDVFNQKKVPVDVTAYLKMLSEANTPEQFSTDYENYVAFFEKIIERQAQNPDFAWKLPFLKIARSPTRDVFNQKKVPVDMTSYLRMLSKANTPEQFSTDYENYESEKVSPTEKN